MRRFLILLFFVLFVCLTQSTEAKKLALLVGVDDYDGAPSLKCCVNDIKTLKEALMKIGFEEDDIQVLVTGGQFRDLPTKKKIEQKIATILSEAESKDLVFFAFSGHGAQDGKTVYFCPPDVETDDLEGSCVSITKVMDDLAQCKAKFKWMVVDACRNDPSQKSKGIGGKGLQTIPSPPAGIALFQSCAEGEESWEDHASGNGYFTKNFAAALSGEADANHDGTLTLMEVCTWTTAQTKAQVKASEGKSQKPYFSGSVSDFPLTEDLNVPKAKALAEEAQKAMDAKNYALAIEKYDAALALWEFNYWKRERDLAKLLLENSKPEPAPQSTPSTAGLTPTSRDSFRWEGTKITKFIGKETDVVIPEGTTVIGNIAFEDCESLRSVIVPESVTQIETYAFSSCTALESVTIPDSVKEIGGGAFIRCPALKQWSISSTHPYFKSDGTFLLTKDGKKIIACLGTRKEYRIPEGVTVIGDAVFKECNSLEYVTIPGSVQEIGDGAFSGCSSLKSVTIPGSVQEIGDFAFSRCTNLESVTIPKGVKVIGYGAFNECSSLESVTIPDSVTTIEEFAFSATSLRSVVIPEGVTVIRNQAFSDCNSLRSVTIPGSVTTIGWAAFWGCSDLKTVTISKGVKEIGECMFNKCTSLESVVIPEGVREIGDSAFSGCSSLKSATIPGSVTEIGSIAFYACPNLTIYAPAGSEAERYAKSEKIPFQAK